MTEVDVYARFLRMQGFNVLYPIAFHISGTPVLGISLAIKNKDKEKIAQYIEYVRPYVSSDIKAQKIVKSFEDPSKIVSFFIPKMKEEYSRLGLSVDWRRSFTSGDIEHQKLVEWQFGIYKRKKYLVQGEYPVLFSLTLENAVGEDDIIDGDINPVEKQEFTLLKFRFGDAFIIAGTLRPETMFGQTNMWANPETMYVKTQVDHETWIVSKECAEKLQYQKKQVKILGEISGRSLLGKYCHAPFVDKDIPILPSAHCDKNIATGFVTSVPSDAPYDYIALKELQNSEEKCKQIGLPYNTIKALPLIPIIQTKGFSNIPAKDICEQSRITSLTQTELLDTTTAEIYKAGFHTGVLLETCGEFAGLTVNEARQKMRIVLLDNKLGDIFYETSRPARSRDGGKVIVAILDKQWFLDFNAPGWKNLARTNLSKMKITPEKYRKQFEDVFEWLDKRPCTRKRGLGTRFPFDQQWVIESLSDSTLYMSLYTFKDKLKTFDVDGRKLSPAFFDYIFLGKGNKITLSKDVGIKTTYLEEIRKAFEYWYPFDLRHTFTAHLPNHLSFMIFAHTACFPKDKWPKKISFHGMIISEGTKMSKSKGNVVTLREIHEKYGADSFRAFLCTASSGDSNLDWRSREVDKMKTHIDNLFSVISTIAKKKKKGVVKNVAFLSRMERYRKKATESLAKMHLREYSTVVLYDIFREYKRVAQLETDLSAINYYLFYRWVPLLAPVTPHMAEELWESGGRKGFVSVAAWPKEERKNINEKAEFMEDFVDRLIIDVGEIKKLTKKERLGKVTIILAPVWKYSFVKKFKTLFQKEHNVGVLIRNLMDKEHGAEIASLVQLFVKDQTKVPLVVTSQKEELTFLKSRSYFLKKELRCVVEIIPAEKRINEKIKHALPGKPALIVQ